MCRTDAETITWSSSNSEQHATPHRHEARIAGQLKCYCITGGNFPQTLNSGKECDSVRRRYLVGHVPLPTDNALAFPDVSCSNVSRPETSNVPCHQILDQEVLATHLMAYHAGDAV